MHLSLTLFAASAVFSAQDPGVDELLDRLAGDNVIDQDEAISALTRRWGEWNAADLERIEKAGQAGNSEASGRARVAFEEIDLRRRIPGEMWRVEPRVAEIVLHHPAEDVASLVNRLGTGRLPRRSLVPLLIEILYAPRLASIQANVQTALFRVAYKTQLVSREQWRAWWIENQPKPEQAWYLPDLSAPDERQRTIAIERLAVLQDPALYPRILQSVKSLRTRPLLHRALACIERIPAVFLVLDLKPYLGDPRPDVRFAAARLLVERLPRESIDAVIASFESAYPDWEDESFVLIDDRIEWLAATKDDTAWAFLLAEIKSGSADHRFNVGRSVHDQHLPGLNDALLAAMDDPTTCKGYSGRWEGAAYYNPRIADMAGIVLAHRLRMTEKFVWTGPVEERDRNLAKIREHYKRAKE